MKGVKSADLKGVGWGKSLKKTSGKGVFLLYKTPLYDRHLLYTLLFILLYHNKNSKLKYTIHTKKCMMETGLWQQDQTMW